MAITIVYDNNPHAPELQPAWGFGCVVQGLDKTILFDTGGDGGILLANMRKLGIAPEEIDIVVLSHVHGDHTGGLESLLKENGRPTVYMPASFPSRIKKAAARAGARIIEVKRPCRICRGARSTGEMGTFIKEQSLLLDTQEGVCVITGCAHPGVVAIVRRALEISGSNVALVLGGFHMAGASDRRIKAVMAELTALGVRRLAPCHCSGERTRELFQRACPEGFAAVGLGARIELQLTSGETESERPGEAGVER